MPDHAGLAFSKPCSPLFSINSNGDLKVEFTHIMGIITVGAWVKVELTEGELLSPGFEGAHFQPKHSHRIRDPVRDTMGTVGTQIMYTSNCFCKTER